MQSTISRSLAALPTRPLLALLVVTEWILAGVTWLRVGHEGSLAVVVPQVVILLPAALVLVYGVALELGGRAFAIWASSLWTVLPFAGIAYALPSLRHDYVHEFLPHVLGLADDAAVPAMVAFLAALSFTLRAIDRNRSVDVAIAVGAAAIGAVLVPRAALVALAPILGLALARRRRYAIGAVVALAVVLACVAAAVAAGTLASPFAHVAVRAGGNTLKTLSENFWSGRVIEWIAIAGVVGTLRGNRPAGAMVGVAVLAAFLSLPAEPTPIARNVTLLRDLVPVWPAVTLAVASVPLLLPRRRPAEVERATAQNAAA
jgi:hypothetical protein